MIEKEIKLNIGAGQTYLPGFINLDISPLADISVDLGKEPLPFPDNSVSLIFSYHTLEHVNDYLFALSEIHRVLRHGGRLLVGLPYVTLTEFHLVNPYHRHNFNEFSFDFFDPNRLKGSAAETNPIQFIQVYHRFHYMGGFNYLPGLMRTWCRRHLFNVVREIEFGLVAVKENEPLPMADRAVWEAEFLSCLAGRRGYEKS